MGVCWLKLCWLLDKRCGHGIGCGGWPKIPQALLRTGCGLAEDARANRKCGQVPQNAVRLNLCWGPPRGGNRRMPPALRRLGPQTTPLSPTALSSRDKTATSMASVVQIDRLHLEPRCHVCRNDEVRQQVNEMLAAGASYAMTLRPLGDDAVGLLLIRFAGTPVAPTTTRGVVNR